MKEQEAEGSFSRKWNLLPLPLFDSCHSPDIRGAFGKHLHAGHVWK